MIKKKTGHINIRVDEKLKLALDSLAEYEEDTSSDIIRDALNAYILLFSHELKSRDDLPDEFTEYVSILEKKFSLRFHKIIESIRKMI